MRTSLVPIAFSAKVRISLTAVGARCFQPSERVLLWRLMVYSRVTTSWSACLNGKGVSVSVATRVDLDAGGRSERARAAEDSFQARSVAPHLHGLDLHVRQAQLV